MVGETVSGISNVASGSYLTIQPSSGEEWVLQEFGSSTWVNGTAPDGSGYPNIDVMMYDGGAYHVPVYYRARVDSAGHLGKGIILTNTLYARILNAAGSAADLAYTGIQTK